MNSPIPNSYGWMEPSGTGANGILLLGEAMGEDEVGAHRAFVEWGKSGAVLERAIRKVGTNRDQYVLWNVVPTHPPNDYLVGAPWESDAIAWGLPQLEEVIARYKPRVIVALGGTAIRATTGLCGPKLGVNNLAGFVLPTRFHIPVVASFHPAYLRRGKMSHMGTLIRALKVARTVAQEGLSPISPPIENPPPGYNLFPSEEAARNLLAGAASGNWDYLAYDIETPYSTNEEEAEEHEGVINSIQFSLSPGSGQYWPWREPYTSIARELLSLPIPKLSWNGWRFDEPRLAQHGVVINGVNHDLMWAWHHLQPDIPRGLQFAAAQLGWPWPWKHLDKESPNFYGIVDVDVLSWMVSGDPNTNSVASRIVRG